MGFSKDFFPIEVFPKGHGFFLTTKVFSQEGFFLNEWLTEDAEMATYSDKHQREDRFFPEQRWVFLKTSHNEEVFSQNSHGFSSQYKGFFPKMGFSQQQPTEDAENFRRLPSCQEKVFSQQGFFLTTTDRGRRNLS